MRTSYATEQTSAYEHARIHTRIHAYTHTHTHTRAHSLTHTHTYTHTHTHTHTRTHTHAHVHAHTNGILAASFVKLTQLLHKDNDESRVVIATTKWQQQIQKDNNTCTIILAACVRLCMCVYLRDGDRFKESERERECRNNYV
jgi:hypothetical protein